MSDLNKLLKTYADPSSDKIQVIREMEFVEDENKWPFLIQVLTNLAAEDLERIEILRILEVTQPPQEYVNNIADSIYDIITSEKDEDVRNYAVIASKNFASDKLLILSKNILLNKDEDIDIRWNALDVIKNTKNKEILNEVVDKLRTDKEFDKAIERLISSKN